MANCETSRRNAKQYSTNKLSHKHHHKKKNIYICKIVKYKIQIT